MSDALSGAGAPTPTGPLALSDVRECPDCGQFHAVRRLRPGDTAHCRRCDGVVRRGRAHPVARPLAFAITGLFLFLAAAHLPYLAIAMSGQSMVATLPGNAQALDHQGLWAVALLVFVTTLLAPAAKLLGLTAVLGGLYLPRPPRELYVVFRWIQWLRPWAMIEVFMLAVLVAYTRLTVLATVDVGPALYALGGLIFAVAAADATLGREAVWQSLQRRGLTARPDLLAQAELGGSGETRAGAGLIACDTCALVLRGCGEGEECPRCGALLRHRKPESLPRTWSLLAAAAVFYIPANTYPMMTITQLGGGVPYTILEGIRELLELGMWPLAALVFFASILVPVLKIFSLGWMAARVTWPRVDHLRERTWLYRIVETIGRWSMIDVFVVTILVALVRMGVLASVMPGPGVLAFAAVVVLTMLAAQTFDPRLMWDAAARAARRRSPSSTPAGRTARA